MYKKEEVFNIRNKPYELTPIDEQIYNEIGYVLHQVDDPYSEHSHIVYKEHFGTILNQKIISVNIKGNTSATMWYLNREAEKDCRDLELTEKEKELLLLKHKELMNGYWAGAKTKTLHLAE